MKLKAKGRTFNTRACLSLCILTFLTIDAGGMDLYTCIFFDQEE